VGRKSVLARIAYGISGNVLHTPTFVLRLLKVLGSSIAASNSKFTKMAIFDELLVLNHQNKSKTSRRTKIVAYNMRHISTNAKSDTS
jgi:hypothetical protein